MITRRFIPISSFAFVAAFVTCAAWAEEPNQHPIDVAFETAIERDFSTAGMLAATAQAEAAWERELGKQLENLRQQLEPGARTALDASQEAWELFRRAELKLAQETHGKEPGSLYRVTGAALSLELVKQRALHLTGYLAAFDGGSSGDGE